MEFGSGRFNWSDSSYPFEKSFLRPRSKRLQTPYLGLPQWSVPEWKQNFYTAHCSSKNFLKEYSQRLDCVEVSSTFYADVGENTLKKWRESVPENFRFLPKWPQVITHQKLLTNCQRESQNFTKKMQLLGPHLGVTLLQLPPHFSVQFKRELFHFLCDLPEGFPIAVEFRHESWFEDLRLYAKLQDYFIKNNIGMVCSDTPSRRDVFHLSFTGPCNVIRFLSDQDQENDIKRLNTWTTWLDNLQEGGQFFFVLHQPNNGLSPQLIPHFSPEKAKEIESLRAGPQRSLF